MSRAKLLIGAVAAAPVLTAGAAGLRYTARAAAARRSGASLEPGVPTPAPSFGLAGAVALDTFITQPMSLLASMGSAEQYARASAELDDAVRFYDDAGWLDDPAGRHPAPTAAPDAAEVAAARMGRHDVELVRFESGWQPVDGEPGADRWAAFDANTSVPVRVLRHPGPARPWLVAVHGQGMGRPSDDRMLRALRLHDELGINVALPVLPLHGPRAAGFAPDQQFVSNIHPVNNVLGLTQAVWDLRRLVLWLRHEHEAPAVGVLGLSLGSYACSLLSTVEADLACVVAVVPTSDLADTLRRSPPAVPSKRRLHRALHDERSTLVHRVVSPVARPCVVPRHRRFIVAGQVDRVASPAGAAELWRHWDEPSILWRPRGHVTTARSSVFDDHVERILRDSGLHAPR